MAATLATGFPPGNSLLIPLSTPPPDGTGPRSAWRARWLATSCAPLPWAISRHPTPCTASPASARWSTSYATRSGAATRRSTHWKGKKKEKEDTFLILFNEASNVLLLIFFFFIFPGIQRGSVSHRSSCVRGCQGHAATARVKVHPSRGWMQALCPVSYLCLSFFLFDVWCCLSLWLLIWPSYDGPATSKTSDYEVRAICRRLPHAHRSFFLSF